MMDFDEAYFQTYFGGRALSAFASQVFEELEELQKNKKLKSKDKTEFFQKIEEKRKNIEILEKE